MTGREAVMFGLGFEVHGSWTPMVNWLPMLSNVNILLELSEYNSCAILPEESYRLINCAYVMLGKQIHVTIKISAYFFIYVIFDFRNHFAVLNFHLPVLLNKTSMNFTFFDICLPYLFVCLSLFDTTNMINNKM